MGMERYYRGFICLVNAHLILCGVTWFEANDICCNKSLSLPELNRKNMEELAQEKLALWVIGDCSHKRQAGDSHCYYLRSGGIYGVSCTQKLTGPPLCESDVVLQSVSGSIGGVLIIVLIIIGLLCIRFRQKRMVCRRKGFPRNNTDEMHIVTSKVIADLNIALKKLPQASDNVYFEPEKLCETTISDQDYLETHKTVQSIYEETSRSCEADHHHYATIHQGEHSSRTDQIENVFTVSNNAKELTSGSMKLGDPYYVEILSSIKDELTEESAVYSTVESCNYRLNRGIERVDFNPAGSSQVGTAPNNTAHDQMFT